MLSKIGVWNWFIFSFAGDYFGWLQEDYKIWINYTKIQKKKQNKKAKIGLNLVESEKGIVIETMPFLLSKMDGLADGFK